jgi:multidrug efflux pump subunit AcrA (membrane-fusion protein)
MVALSAGSGVRQIQLLGQVEASEQATIRSRTDGTVQQVLVHPGDRVIPGQTLVILDDADQQLALAEAQARLAQERSRLARLEIGTRQEIIDQRRAAVRSARAREQAAQDNLRRTTDLVNEGAVSQRLLVEARAAVDDATGDRLAAEATFAEASAGPTPEEIDAQRATVNAAKASVKQSKLALQRTRIVALSTAIVQSRQVSPGDYLESADPVLTLVSQNNLDLFLELPEELSGSVTPGLPITLTARALPRWRGRAPITAVVPSTDAASRRQRIRVRLTNPPSGLLSGMAVTGNLERPSSTRGFVVLRDVLTQRQNQWVVFTVTDGKAQQHPVELVADMGAQVAISSPQLQAGQKIVSRGGDGLKDGAPVNVVN